VGVQKVRLQLDGKKFSRWTVLEFDSIKNNHSYWQVKCKCGVEKVLQGHLLTSGHSKSCGCLQREIVSKPKSKKHKRKISEGNKGKIVSEETRKKMSKSAKNRIVSKETCKKISKKLKGKYLGSNNPFYGKKHSEETKNKLREKMSGINSPRWNPHKTDEERINGRHIYGYNEWRKSVYERDDYTCQKCGDDRGGKLNAHHIKNYANNKKLRTETSNGITFCKSCHKDFHNQYGKKDNTRIQLEEFLSM